MSGRQAWTGGCLCGAVRYEAVSPPRIVAHCHCTLCRRASAAPFVTWAVFRVADFRVLRGETASYASSGHAVRRFCPRCGTQLTFEDHERAHHVDVTVASLDEPAAAMPERHIWMSSRLPWLELGDDLPKFEDGGA